MGQFSDVLLYHAKNAKSPARHLTAVRRYSLLIFLRF
nr:MAG TPA: hypothetical protein [Caudoviricetes sp.]DAP87421.1 MAG TPA: hypothetical protein [Caudoviricetes sp.]